MERWFKKIHLDHEYDEEPQPPVNLLLLGEEGDENQIANNQDEMKAFSEMASKFMSDFSVNSVNPVSQQPARPQAKPSMKMNMKISQQCKHSPETLKRNEIAKLTRELRLQPKHSQFITRRKSRSQQEKDDLKLIRVQPSACKIDNALRNDVSKVLQAHNQSIQARRMADKRPVKSSVQPVKTLIQPVQQKPSKSDGKLKNEIMELLNSHNQTVKAKRTVIRH